MDARLDDAVREAYGMPDDADPLGFLLAPNLELATREKTGEKSTPPRLPLTPGEKAAFVTNDYVQPVLL